MICAIHQPQTFPWLGYFAKIHQADIFVFLDNVQYKKNEWQNRNKIKTPEGSQWLTVPVLHRFGQAINEIQINNTVDWRHKHLQTLRTYYGKAPYFEQYFPEIEDFYHADWTTLSAFNLQTINFLMEKIGIRTPCRIASQMPEITDSAKISPDERLILITRCVGADTYLSGAGGHDYLAQELFPQNHIRLIFQQFKHPDYRQLYGDFLPYLSTLDLLFNEGPQALSIIEGGIQ